MLGLPSKSNQDSENAPNSYQYVNCHIVFNIKSGDFYRKAYLEIKGLMIHTPFVIICSM